MAKAMSKNRCMLSLPPALVDLFQHCASNLFTLVGNSHNAGQTGAKHTNRGKAGPAEMRLGNYFFRADEFSDTGQGAWLDGRTSLFFCPRLS
jgi:hypothetical protein